MQRSLRLAAIILALIFGSAALPGCGKPFNVKPRADLPLLASAGEARLGDARIQASPVDDEDFLYDTFDANLLQAGVLPVNLWITNGGSEPFSLKGIKIELRGSGGSRYERLSARKTYKRLIAYYEVSTYNKRGYKSSLEDFGRYEFPWDDPVNPGDRRNGLVFFSIGGGKGTEPLLLVLQRRGGEAAQLELVRQGG